MHLRRGHFALSALIVVFSAAPAFAEFRGTTVGIASGRSSITVDSAHHPHMSYVDDSDLSNFILRHAFVNVSGFGVIETVDTGDVGFDSSIAVDAFDRIHISYHADKPSPALKYAFFDGVTWTTETVDQGGFATSIAVDANNNPHISYLGGSGSELRYATFDGANWNLETIPGAMPFFTTSLALEATGAAQIAFDESTLPRTIRRASNGTGSWVLDAVAEGHSPAIAFDTAGMPRVVYTDEAAFNLELASFDGMMWTSEIIASGGEQGDIAIDSDDAVHVSFGRFQGGVERLSYARRENGVWEITTIGGKNSGFNTAIALDPLELPHISSRRSLSENASVLQYHVRLEPDLEASWSDVAVTTPSNRFVVAARFHVENTGTGAAKRFTVSFFLSDDATLDGGDLLIRTRRLPTVQPGDEAVQRFSTRSDSPLSGKFIIALVEEAGSAEDTDESDNVAAFAIP